MYGYIYKITNNINGKIYIGKREKSTFDESYWGSGKCIINSIKKYGKENFSREIIEWCDDRASLCEREKYWIDKMQAKNRLIGYNIADGGNGISLSGSLNGMYGKHHTEEFKQKMSERMSGENNPAHNPETAEKISKALMGHVPSEETRKLWSIQRRGKTPYNKGKSGIYSEETLMKMRSAKLGKTLSEEHKKKIGNTERAKNLHWYTNGVDNIKCNEKDKPLDYYRGRTYKFKESTNI